MISAEATANDAIQRVIIKHLGHQPSGMLRLANTVLDTLRSLPIEQRMEVLGMESRGVQHDDHNDHQHCRPTCEEVWAEQ